MSMSVSEISQLLKKLNNLNEELVKFELASIFTVGVEQRQHVKAKLQVWNLTKQAFIKDLTPALLSQFSLCYDTLYILQSLINLNMDSRFDTLSTELEKENPHFDDKSEEKELNEKTEAMHDDVKKRVLDNMVFEEKKEIHGITEVQEEKPHDDVKRRVLEKIVVTCRALLGEIKQELNMEKAGNKRKTITEWLSAHKGTPYLPFEWQNLNELRIKALLAAIQLSKLLVQFMFSLNGDERRLCSLQSKIIVIPKKQQGSVSGKFDILLKTTRNVMSNAKQRGEWMGTQDEEVLNNMMVQFSEAIIGLEYILCCENVPETRNDVAGARMRLEDGLAQTLFIMHTLKLRVPSCKQHNAATWKMLKEYIVKMWNLERRYGR